MRLLQAARRLLETGGYSSLSVKAIGREAGESESLIWYHFGSKAGLLVALADWLLYDYLRHLQDLVAHPVQGLDQLHAAIDQARRLTTDAAAYHAYYDLLPYLLSERETRRHLAELYSAYRELNAKAIAAQFGPPDTPNARALAAMTVALPDGLALQLLLDPGSIDMQHITELWEAFLRQVLAGGGRADADSEGNAQ